MRRATNHAASVETHRETALSIPLIRYLLVPILRNQKMNFARDLRERLGILALLALSAPFRICKLQILLATRETDPVSSHHLESITYEDQNESLPLGRLSLVNDK